MPFNFLPQQCFCLSKKQVLQFFKVHFFTVECQLSKIHTGILNDRCQHEMPGFYHLLPHLCSGVVRIRNRPPNSQTHTHSFNIFIFTVSYVPDTLGIHSLYLSHIWSSSQYTHICILFFRFFSIICYYKLRITELQTQILFLYASNKLLKL